MDGTPDAGNLANIQAAEICLPAPDLAATIAFFVDRLGFRLMTIFPADDPATAVVAGHGLRLRLERDGGGDAGTLRILIAGPEKLADGETDLQAPNGTRIEIADADPPLHLPPIDQSFVIQKMDDAAPWIVGRAGMLYRDLIPDREGGRFIASHIRIPDGGPVPDNVHFHKIRFQMIYCYKGWVRLVYEDQGDPFILKAGDCVLQPPEIRHRVLECSDGLEVIEIGCPAEHITCLDHDMALPTGRLLPERAYGGQYYVRHQVDAATWHPWRIAGFEARDLGIGAATDGLAGVRVARVAAPTAGKPFRHAGEFLFLFVLAGDVRLEIDDSAAAGPASYILSAGDCATIPAGLAHALASPSSGLEILEVTLPADIGGPQNGV